MPRPLIAALETRDRHGREAGFTVIELLVALTVTIIGLAGLLSLHVTTVRGNASASRSLEAVSLADESLEILRSKTIGDIEQAYGLTLTTSVQSVEFGATTPTSAFGPSLITGRANQQYNRRLHLKILDATQPNLIWVQAEVVWNEGAPPPSFPAAGERSIKVETIRSRSEAL